MNIATWYEAEATLKGISENLIFKEYNEHRHGKKVGE